MPADAPVSPYADMGRNPAPGLILCRERDGSPLPKEVETHVRCRTPLPTAAVPPADKPQIEHIIEDERKHYCAFNRAYACLTGRTAPPPEVSPMKFDTYTEALEASFEDEREAQEFYREVYFDTYCYPEVSRTFESAMLDEMEHMSIFTLLYARATAC